VFFGTISDVNIV